jgi:hypothetical protein
MRDASRSFAHEPIAVCLRSKTVVDFPRGIQAFDFSKRKVVHSSSTYLLAKEPIAQAANVDSLWRVAKLTVAKPMDVLWRPAAEETP